MTRQIFNIFPTTIYVSEIPNHKKYKDTFYKLYPKYDYEQVTYQDGEEWFNTTSENTGNPFIHLCLLYTSPSPRDRQKSRMPSSA